jgi:formimidoylglutamate deiminase
MSRTFVPELLYRDGVFHSRSSLTVPTLGAAEETILLPGRAMVPGLVNAHSHAFQRLIRGRTESQSKSGDNFWSWRDAMYRAANQLSPDDLYIVARMAFLEMVLSGITTVGEFHYVHRDPQGRAYDDPNLISKLMVQAAREVGLRICLLRVAYARAGFGKEANPLQKRFIEPLDEYLANVEALKGTVDGEFAWVGLAPHSIRAVPLDYLREVANWADRAQVPLHMHASEQPAELEACEAEYGTTPIALLAREGVLGSCFTAVHAIHISGDEIRHLAQAGSTVCACPTTERDLGDGIVAADLLRRAGVRIALGSDSQTRIDLLEDARELEYHLRLQRLERGLLAPEDLLECATVSGARSLGTPPRAGDFFTVDLGDPSLAGATAQTLAATIVFGASRTAVRDVVVGGKFVVRDRFHELSETILKEFRALAPLRE